MADPGPFAWVPSAGRYRGPGGRFVTQSAVRQALYTATDNSAKVMAEASTALREGKLTLRAWQTVMRTEVKNVHLYSAAAVKGGWAQMDQAAYGRVGQRIREQYKFLDRLAAQVASGEVPVDGRFANRAGMYGHSGRQTAHLFERVEKLEGGLTEERSIRDAVNSCDGCLEEEARGWVPIGGLVPIGSRDCKMACHCEIEFR